MTNVTVNEAHSVVKIYTLLIQMYCVKTFSNRKANNIGIPKLITGILIISLLKAIFVCSTKLEEYKKNPGRE